MNLVAAPAERALAPVPAGWAGAPATTGAAGGSAFPELLARTAASAPPAPAPGMAGRVVLDRALLGLGRPAPAGPDGPGGSGAAFVAAAFARAGVAVPAEPAAQARLGVPVASLAEARSGDLVVVAGSPARVGIYAGGGRMVHAPADGGPVRLSAIDGTAAVRRIVDDAPAAAPVGAGLATATAAALLARTPGPAAPAAPAAAGSRLASVPYLGLFQQAAATSGLDAALLAAVARTESGFDPGATSPAGAQGLMQFMPATARELGVDPWDPASAIDGAARYLRSALDRFGSLELALAAYNAGPGAVQRHGGVPPYAETRRYVQKVLEAREQYLR